MYSYWENKYWFKHYDYVIVGSGIVGLTTALLIKQKNVHKSVMIVDRSQIPQGASTKNAGFACFGTVGEIIDDLERISRDEMKSIIKLRWDGLQKLKSIHEPALIDYQELGGYEVFENDDQYEKCSGKINDINQLIYDSIGLEEVFTTRSTDMNDKFHDRMIYNRYEGQLNPVLLVNSLISKIRMLGVQMSLGIVIEDITAQGSLKQLKTNIGIDIVATNVIFCTNAFIGKIYPELDVIPARNQVLVTEKLNDLPVIGTYHFDKGYIYFRNIDNRLLIGGARNLDLITEQTMEFGKNDFIFNELKNFIETRIVQKKVIIDYQWSGIIATGNSKKPILRKVEDGIYLAVRLGGMGVAIGSELAFQLSKMLDE